MNDLKLRKFRVVNSAYGEIEIIAGSKREAIKGAAESWGVKFWPDIAYSTTATDMGPAPIVNEEAPKRTTRKKAEA